MRAKTMLAAGLVAVTAAAAWAQHTHTQSKSGPTQPYAGQQHRAVASLSAEELQGFLDGRGMGFARAAELNGYPGPLHVLELERELQLTPDQHRRIEQAFQRMKAHATDLGRRYVEAERAVDAAFRSAAADAATVAARVAEASQLLGEVRLSHLNAHVEITRLLTAEQRARYAQLRGYADSSADHGTHKH